MIFCTTTNTRFKYSIYFFFHLNPIEKNARKYKQTAEQRIMESAVRLDMESARICHSYEIKRNSSYSKVWNFKHGH